MMTFLTAEEIADILHEPKRSLIQRIIQFVGCPRVEAFLDEALTIEAAGGMLRTDGSRRRTPGGVFFYLVRRGVDADERRWIFYPQLIPKDTYHTNRRRVARNRPPVPRITWDTVQMCVHNYTDAQPWRCSMKLTLIGRPAGTKTEGQVVIFQLQGLPPATLPKELPTLPEHTPITWTVMLGLRQWSKVKESLARDKNDRLVLEGYPLIDGHKHILLVNSCFSVAMQRATKERQKAAAAS